jgi:very-short-patch-repair endonuclease
MEYLALAIFVIAFLAGIAAYGGKGSRPSPAKRTKASPAPSPAKIPKTSPAPAPEPTEALPYQKKWYLLSKAERAFYDTLCAAAGKDLLVFAKVRLLDVLWVPKTIRDRQSHLNRVMSKHVDFVLCDRPTVAPVLVVELDDASDQLPDRADRDAFVDTVLHSTGLPVLRVRARRSYSEKELAELIREEMACGPSEASRRGRNA